MFGTTQLLYKESMIDANGMIQLTMVWTKLNRSKIASEDVKVAKRRYLETSSQRRYLEVSMQNTIIPREKTRICGRGRGRGHGVCLLWILSFILMKVSFFINKTRVKFVE